MGDKFNRFAGNLKIILKNIGKSAEKTFNNLDQADKKIQEKMKQSMGSASQY